MGQVNALEGLYHFVLLSAMIMLAFRLSRSSSVPKKPLFWLMLLTLPFLASFIAHILAFITLKIALGEGIDPWIHRPIVATVWGIFSALVFQLITKANIKETTLAFALTAVGYLVFVLTRHLVP